MHRESSSLRFRPAVTLLLGFALLSAVPPISASEGADSDRDVWITLGADAFDTLRDRVDLEWVNEPPQELSRRSGVVLTRVDESELATVSNAIHESYQRCPGFIRHTDQATARASLARGTQDVGAPINYTIDHPDRVMQLEAVLDQDEIFSTIEALSTQFNNRFHAHPSGTAAAEWIRDLWLGYAQDRPDVTVELFNHPTTTQPSVILTITGTSLPDEVVVLGGHLDSTAPGNGNPNFSAPGADDDASGIAVISETIRVAMAKGFRPERTVSFMGYAAEEVGLVGSQDIAQTYQDNGTNVVAVLQLDMTAFNGSVEDISLITDNTNAELTAFLGLLLDTYLPDLTWSQSACGFGCSDHAAWNSRGYPAAFTFEARFGQHNQFIHSTSDILSTFGNSAAHAFKFARLASAFLVEIGLDRAEEVFDDSFESGTTDEWTVTTP